MFIAEPLAPVLREGIHRLGCPLQEIHLISLPPLNAPGTKNCFQEKVNENQEKGYNDLTREGPEIQALPKTSGEFLENWGAGEWVSRGFGQNYLAGAGRTGRKVASVDVGVKIQGS